MGLPISRSQRSHRASGCVARRTPENSKISFSDEELFGFTQSANVLHQSVDLARTQPSPESRHISSSFSDDVSQLRVRLLLNLCRVKIRGV